MMIKSMRCRVMVFLFVLFGLLIFGLLPIFATDSSAKKQTKKIVFLWSRAEDHPNKAGCELFKYCIENSPNVKGVKCEIYENWPEKSSVLNDAATIVIYSQGAGYGGYFNPETRGEEPLHPVLTPERLKYLDKLMKKGVGMVCVHYSLIADQLAEGAKLAEWIGGYFNFQGHGSVHAMRKEPQVCMPVTSYHPISNGWKEFTLPENELYHNFCFSGNNCPVPILTTHFISLGYYNSKRQVIAWALEREDGGRGFGFGGGHFYRGWMNEDCRKMILNAILWTAKIEVPQEGVLSSVPERLKKIELKRQ